MEVCDLVLKSVKLKPRENITYTKIKYIKYFISPRNVPRELKEKQMHLASGEHIAILILGITAIDSRRSGISPLITFILYAILAPWSILWERVNGHQSFSLHPEFVCTLHGK